MNKLRAIITIIFIFLPLCNAHAIMALELAINNQLKECRPFQPMGDVRLPIGWRFHDNLNTESDVVFKAACEKISYTYIDDELIGRVDPAYLIMVVIYNGLFLVAIISLLLYYLKTKKKIIIIALLGIVFLYMFLHYMLKSMV